MPKEAESDLLRLLREKKAALPKSQMDWTAERIKWTQALQRLCARIGEWLREAQAEGLLKARNHKFTLEEEYLGRYEADGVEIRTIDGQSITVRPAGRNVVGAEGRVDILSGPHRETILLDADGRWMLAERVPGTQF